MVCLTGALFLVVVLHTPCGADNRKTASDSDISGLVESDRDDLGIYLLAPDSYEEAVGKGARVVNLVHHDTFFTLWVPAGYPEMTNRRVLVTAHGHTGNAYLELLHDWAFARQYGFAVVGLQWWTGVKEQHFDARQVYAFMDVALRYMAYRYGHQIGKAAFRGWSFGSEISYEVTYWDRHLETNYLALTISHDGGMRPDPSEMGIGKEFTSRLYAGLYGEDPFAGSRFYLYSGEEPQITYMAHTARVLSARGGQIVRLVLEDGAGHAGFFKPPETFHRDAIKWFLFLTESPPGN